MTMQSGTHAGHDNPVRLWLYLIAGPTLYAGYFVAGYLWVEAVCGANPNVQTFWQQPVLGLPLLMTAELIFSFAVALVTALITWRAAISWRQNREQHKQGEDSSRFLALGGVLLGLLFLLLIVGTAVLLATLAPCNWI